ncbi:hypothetical protein RU09_16670 [Microbacterium sp. MEJ108Y]|uniref:DUF6541 family protein n=1 Tax=Microbacterium sp. MEJ108Y TaxID=1587523 RepID=UPI0005AC303D|nr:DUF6541 family protein [Microbacterium sp. MEJ108Y]KIP88397.1 hypothetical protein RU09_16670 [Microbacterium sp. MEJ108Y]
MSWVSILPALIVTGALLFLPGLLLGFLLRLRGMRLLALAPALSVSLVAVAALAAPFVGIRWSILPVLILTAVAAVAAYFWSKHVGKPARLRQSSNARQLVAVIVSIVVPALLIAFVLVRSMHDPEFFSQRYDNFFHLNAVQYVLDTGNASPLWLGSMTSPAGVPFYPSGWHAMVSIIVALSGASVPLASNAMIIVVAAVVWPIGAVFLVRELLGRNQILTVIAGALAAAFPAFPFLLLHYGVLYPLFLGLAVAPAAIVVAWWLLRPGRVPRRQDWALLLVLVVPGLGVAHPGALMAVVALTVPFVLARLLHQMRTPGRPRLIGIGLLVAYAAAGVVLLQVVRPPASQIYWPIINTVPDSIGEVVAASVYGYPSSLGITALMIIGAYSVIRRGTYARWSILAMAVISAVLYIIVSASPYETLRFWFTAPWYNNPPRIAAFWAIGVLPLAALGGIVLVTWLLRQRLLVPVRRFFERLPIVLIAIVVIALVGVTQNAAIRQAAADIEFTYELRPGGPILSPDELDLMEDLAELVPEDAVIAGDPWTGASFAYGVSGRRVLMPHLLMDLTDDAEAINTMLSTEGDSPEVCAALEDTGVGYVLDFSADGDFQENDGDYSGLDDLDSSPYVELVEQRGDAKLFKIVSCGLGS